MTSDNMSRFTREGGISQDTLDTLIDAIEAIRASANRNAATTDRALRDLIMALGALQGDS